MATDTKAKTAGKNEQFVDQQIDKVTKRIQAAEFGRAILLLVVVTLAYAFVMALFGLSVGNDAGDWVRWVRLGGLATYLLFAGYIGCMIVVRFFRRINPYYVAKQIEESIPDAKNSVVNWLDLRGERMPAMIKSALGQRAAHDLKSTDPDKAVDVRHTWVLGGLLGVLLIGMLVLFIMGPGRFGSLLGQAFFPLRDITLASRTEIVLVTPQEGDLTVSLQQRVDFRVQINGRVPRVNSPEAPRLLYRYNRNDAWAPTPLVEDRDDTWATTLQADQVQNGFWYKIAAGDAETPEYQVKVRGQAQANRFEVTCKYRPYVRVSDLTLVYPNQHAVFPNLKVTRGSELTMLVRTNRKVLEGRIEMEQDNVRKDILGEIDPNDPQAFRVSFVAEKTGKYRVFFTTKEGEENVDRSPYNLDVLPDLPPNVKLTTPGKDVTLAANGTLDVEGFANDDFGIKELVLYFKLDGKETLKPQAYRPGKSLAFADGSFPDKLEYRDFVALDKLKTAADQDVKLAKGNVVEYWLEARDNCDYPVKTGNIGKSAVFKINIETPQDEKKSQDDRKKAEQDRQQHEKQQDQKLKEEQEERNNTGNPQSKDQKDEAKNLKDRADRLNDALEQEEKKKKGESKSDNEPPKADKKDNPENKDSGSDQPKPNAKDDKQQKAGDGQASKSKGSGGGDNAKKPEQQAGNSKNEGPPQKDQKPETGSAKNQGDEKNQQPPAHAKGDDKKNSSPNQAGEKGSAKEEPKDKGKAGEAKNQGDKSAKQNPGQARESDPKSGETKSQAKDQKPDGGEGAKPQVKESKDSPGDNHAKGDNKSGQGDKNDAKAKGADKKNNPGETGHAKDPGPSAGEKPAASKGQPEPSSSPDKSARKDQGEKLDKENQPQAHGSKGSKDAGNSKKSEPDKSAQAGTSKDDSGRGSQKGRDPTLADVERLKNKIKRGGDEGEDAIRELTKALEDVKDPKVQEAIKQAFKETGKEPSLVPDNNPMANNQNPKKPDPTKQPTNPPDKGTDPSAKTGPNSSGLKDDPRAAPVNEDYRKRLGEFQLDPTKVTPEVLKKAGMTEKEFKKYLEDVRAYEELLNRQRDQASKTDPQNVRGQSGFLPNVGPRLVEPNRGATVGPAQGNRGLPPIEFREKYHNWTTKSEKK